MSPAVQTAPLSWTSFPSCLPAHRQGFLRSPLLTRSIPGRRPASGPGRGQRSALRSPAAERLRVERCAPARRPTGLQRVLGNAGGGARRR